MYSRAFCNVVDEATLGRGNEVWVEKTPHHLYQIPLIVGAVHGAGFIHILRDGRDVTASIRDASHQDPEYWGEWSTQSLVQRWNGALKASLAYRRNPAHILVSYEALVENPTSELGRVCDFMGVSFETEMLRHWEAAHEVTGWMGSRSWMQRPFEKIRDTYLKKFVQVFTPAERQYLEEHLLWGGDIGRVVAQAQELTLRGTQRSNGAAGSAGPTPSVPRL